LNIHFIIKKDHKINENHIHPTTSFHAFVRSCHNLYLIIINHIQNINTNMVGKSHTSFIDVLDSSKLFSSQENVFLTFFNISFIFQFS